MACVVPALVCTGTGQATGSTFRLRFRVVNGIIKKHTDECVKVIEEAIFDTVIQENDMV